jgi:hypothetical protein
LFSSDGFRCPLNLPARLARAVRTSDSGQRDRRQTPTQLVEIEIRVARSIVTAVRQRMGRGGEDAKDRGGVVRRKKGLTINWRMARDHENGGNSRKYLKGVAKVDRYGDRWAVQSTLSGSSSDPVGAVDNAGFWAAKMGLRRCSWSRALTALSRSRNQVFSGQLQLPSTSE